jgi:hypothetical protein
VCCQQRAQGQAVEVSEAQAAQEQAFSARVGGGLARAGQGGERSVLEARGDCNRMRLGGEGAAA